MSEAREFFRICPACGRRFHIRLVNKELLDEKKHTEELKRATGVYRGGSSLTVVETGVPITIDLKEFQYSYKCKHCGHEWSEMHTKVSK